ncbi:MAG: hypothetical protein LC799_08405, partial [Actinobacteria bacterium]|nr:hypothetical protein [Actinomycetota bacterium]
MRGWCAPRRSSTSSTSPAWTGDFGPFFLKFSTYFPSTATLCINGNEWAKRQATKAGIGFEALEGGFAAVEEVNRLQQICDSFGPEHIEALLRKWLKIVPNPFTPEDETAGYRYELSILQGRVLSDPDARGPGVRADLLRAGPPATTSTSPVLTRSAWSSTGASSPKGRHPTPGRFRTRVITEGVTPSLHVDYKNAKIKQYHKEGRALRTETTINDTRDFGLSQRLTDQNLTALRQIGCTANRRLLRAGRISHDPIRGAQTFTDLTTPIVTDTGTRIPGLRFGDTRVHALLHALLIHRLLPHGFTNRD